MFSFGKDAHGTPVTHVFHGLADACDILLVNGGFVPYATPKSGYFHKMSEVCQPERFRQGASGDASGVLLIKLVMINLTPIQGYV